MAQYHFVTPIDNADERGEYSTALIQTLDEDKVKNIAHS